MPFAGVERFCLNEGTNTNVKYFRCETSPFLSMEVHDHGNNLIPFKPGIVITVEPGIVLPEFSVVLEDDIL